MRDWFLIIYNSIIYDLKRSCADSDYEMNQSSIETLNQFDILEDNRCRDDMKDIVLSMFWDNNLIPNSAIAEDDVTIAYEIHYKE